MVQKRAPEEEESNQDGLPSYDDATENGPSSEYFLYFCRLCSPIISFFPRWCWETETRRVDCSTDANTASLTGISILAFSYGLRIYIASTISHSSAIIYAFSNGLQLYKPSIWRASRISAASEPPWDDLSPIWIACAPYSFWFARLASILIHTVLICWLFCQVSWQLYSGSPSASVSVCWIAELGVSGAALWLRMAFVVKH